MHANGSYAGLESLVIQARIGIQSLCNLTGWEQSEGWANEIAMVLLLHKPWLAKTVRIWLRSWLVLDLSSSPSVPMSIISTL